MLDGFTRFVLTADPLIWNLLFCLFLVLCALFLEYALEWNDAEA